jgi:hypothetical protein
VSGLGKKLSCSRHLQIVGIGALTLDLPGLGKKPFLFNSRVHTVVEEKQMKDITGFVLQLQVTPRPGTSNLVMLQPRMFAI